MPTPIRVGIIANPVSARDIRRVMSHAAGLPLAERANMVLRIVQAALRKAGCFFITGPGRTPWSVCAQAYSAGASFQ